jgi:hypothetical protein
MPNLNALTTGELNAAERACQHLMALHDQHDAIDRELYMGVSTLLADVHMTQEDRAEAERRHRVGLAAQQSSVLPS